MDGMLLPEKVSWRWYEISKVGGTLQIVYCKHLTQYRRALINTKRTEMLSSFPPSDMRQDSL